MSAKRYINGSKVTTFRLPIDKFEEASERINNILKEYEGKEQPQPKKSTQCGCIFEGVLFRRHKDCKISKELHLQ